MFFFLTFPGAVLSSSIAGYKAEGVGACPFQMESQTSGEEKLWGFDEGVCVGSRGVLFVCFYAPRETYSLTYNPHRRWTDSILLFHLLNLYIPSIRTIVWHGGPGVSDSPDRNDHARFSIFIRIPTGAEMHTFDSANLVIATLSLLMVSS